MTVLDVNAADKVALHITAGPHHEFNDAISMVVLCDDTSVIGSEFYVMERVEGTILGRDLPPGMDLSEAEVRGPEDRDIRQSLRLDALARDVVERDVVTRQRTDMRDPVAHLPGADDAYLADFHLCSPASPASPDGSAPATRWSSAWGP